MEVKIKVEKKKDLINKVSFFLLIVLIGVLIYLILGNLKKFIFWKNFLVS